MRLKPGGKPLAVIKPGERHSFPIQLTRGQFIRIDLWEKTGVDLVMTVFGPGHRVVARTGGYNGERRIDGYRTLRSLNGQLSLAMVADLNGVHKVVLEARDSQISGQYEIAIKEIRDASPVDRRVIEAERLLEAGEQIRIFSRDGWARAEQKFEAARLIFEAIGDRRGQAAALEGRGNINARLKAFDKAINFFEAALGLTRGFTDPVDSAHLLVRIGWMYRALDKIDTGIVKAREALEIARGTGNRMAEATVLNALSHISARGLDDEVSRNEVVTLIEQSASIVRELNSPADEVGIYYQLGAFHDFVSDKPRSAEAYQRGLLLSRQIGNRRMVVFGLLHLGENAFDRGDYQQSSDYFGEAYEHSRGTNDKYEAYTLYNLGNSTLTLDRTRVLEHLTRALPLWGLDRNGEAYTMTSIGRFYFTEGRKKDAIDQYLRALVVMRISGDPYGEGIILSHLGEAYASMNDPARALEYYGRALELHRSSRDRRGEARTQIRIGEVHQELGQIERAVSLYRSAFENYRIVGNRSGEAGALFSLAKAARAAGNVDDARSNIEAALSIVESLRAGIAGAELRSAYYSSVQAYYEFYADVLMTLHNREPAQGFDQRALETAERGKARGLSELLSAANVDLREGIDRSLLDREAELQKRLDSKNAEEARLIAAGRGSGEIEAIERELLELSEGIATVRGKISAANPRARELIRSSPVSSAEIQQLLDNESTLLVYKLGQERSFLWVITQKDLRSFVLPKRIDIEAAARRVYELITARNHDPKSGSSARARVRVLQADGAFDVEAQKLAQMLLGPAGPFLDSPRLVIVADGLLQYIPFGALPNPNRPGQPLALSNELTYLPSASTLGALRSLPRMTFEPGRTVAVFADPVFSTKDPRVRLSNAGAPRSKGSLVSKPAIAYSTQRALYDFGLGGRIGIPRLPFSRREAETIVSIAGKDASLRALDFSASRTAAASSEPSKYRIVHFATHGLLNSSHPELSGLLFSLVNERGEPQNGFLRLQDIYEMKLGADLVVLSACQTGLGRNVSGEGLIGLTRGFMYAGAPRVVASLWKVDDAATAALMEHFYRQMLIEKLPAGAALRKAQMLLREDHRWRSPYYWAAFTLQGEWK
ncbi:MAG: CHAT domain-containing protein [Acidobacteria bacterium]|nr:CHAT domain-containing protein [Acidobacteriota bacterium]